MMGDCPDKESIGEELILCETNVSADVKDIGEVKTALALDRILGVVRVLCGCEVGCPIVKEGGRCFNGGDDAEHKSSKIGRRSNLGFFVTTMFSSATSRV